MEKKIPSQKEGCMRWRLQPFHLLDELLDLVFDLRPSLDLLQLRFLGRLQLATVDLLLNANWCTRVRRMSPTFSLSISSSFFCRLLIFF